MDKSYRIKRNLIGESDYFYKFSETGFSKEKFSIFHSEILAKGIINAFETITEEVCSLISFEVELIEEEFFYPRYLAMAKEVDSLGYCPNCGRKDFEFSHCNGDFYCNICNFTIDKKFFDMIKKE